MRNEVTRIETNRLIIREYTLDDAAELIAILKPNIDYMLPWIPWAKNEPETLKAKRERIKMWRDNNATNTNYYTYGIFKKETGEMIGTVYLFTRRGKGILEIGYWIDRRESGRGFATECSYAVTKLGFEHIGMDKMEIHCDTGNTASSRIPHKLGYTNEFDYRVLEKDEDGNRRVFKAWVMFREEFNSLQKYEPVQFDTAS